MKKIFLSLSLVLAVVLCKSQNYDNSPILDTNFSKIIHLKATLSPLSFNDADSTVKAYLYFRAWINNDSNEIACANPYVYINKSMSYIKAKQLLYGKTYTNMVDAIYNNDTRIILMTAIIEDNLINIPNILARRVK